MTRCDVKHCDMPIKSGGYVCVVCHEAACAHHSNATNLEFQCCDNDLRDCSSCGVTRPANDGDDIGCDFRCRVCANGAKVLAVKLWPAEMDQDEWLPSVGLRDDSPNEVIA